MYNKTMLVEYDPVKDLVNLEKHGVSLARAGLLDWATALIRTDTRFDYHEARYQAPGLLDMRVHLAAFTLRDDALRDDWRTLLELAASGKEMNRTNGLLIHQHMNRNQAGLHALRGGGQPAVYGRDGQQNIRTSGRSFVAG